MGAEGVKQSKENSITYTQALGKTRFHIHGVVDRLCFRNACTASPLSV